MLMTAAFDSVESPLWVAGQQPIPLKPFPASNHRKNGIMDHQKMEPPNSTVPKVAETKKPIKVLHAMRTGVSTEAGAGRVQKLQKQPPLLL